MSVKEVPMWRVTCDVCNDGNNGEYWAWNDHDGAVDDWVDADDFFMDSGEAFHRGCVPFERCPVLGADEGHTWESNGVCGEGCDRTVLDVVNAAAAVSS